MTWIAMKMLMGDRSKYFAIIFGVTFAFTLIRQLALQSDHVAVVVTHAARVFEFGDRIITLDDGKVA